jgi:serine/threonine protein kinase
MNSRGPDVQYIDGRYALTQRLGRTGRVWRAFDTRQQFEVAMRELRLADAELVETDPIGADSLRRRVLAEAGALAQLRHPNVVSIVDLVDAASVRYPWMVMELVAGGSLEDHLTRRLLTPREAASVGRSMLAALAAARAVGILHRNLKPSNVLLRPDGTPLLTDFALTSPRDAGRQAASGTLTGSPDYIAPERVRGEEGDPASDLWSLGMVLYVAVAGRNPLHRGTDLATMAAVLDEPLPLPAQAGSLAEALSALLVRDPVARPGMDVLDRMLADAQRDQAAWTAPPARGADPFAGRAAAGPGHREHQEPPSSWTPDERDQRDQPPPRAARSEPAEKKPVPKRTPAEPAQRGGRRVAVVVASVAAMGLVGALLWVVTGGGSANATGDQGAGQTTAPPSTSASSSASLSPSTSASGLNLLTPAGMNTLVSSLSQAIGGTQVLQLTVYSTYALMEVPDKTTSGTYDSYEYSNGQAQLLTGGSITPPGDSTMSMSSVNWNVLTSLLQKAAANLNVRNPTSEYIVMDPNWPEAAAGPSLRVYISNGTNTGYLVSDTSGNIQNSYPFTP